MLVASLGVLIALGLMLAVVLNRGGSDAPPPSAIGGRFQLVDQRGQSVDERVLLGRPSLLFFGFTHCPDICPTKLFELAQVMQRLGPAADRVRVIMVSVDPERDTPELLATYLASFDPRFMGLTGSPEGIAAMAQAWRAYHRKVPLEGGGYTVDHSALVYWMDAQARFVAPLDVSDPDRAAARLRASL